ncbi:hypothetical protein FRC10_006996 [Ceratobasidium sp. 414]|nr:hypothetical protein FRC10_006996 [Ceratobasidium sp. 414]
MPRSPPDDMWKRHRQLTGPSMSRRYLERMSSRVSTGANNLVRLWTRRAGLVEDRAFDADKDLKLAIMDTIVSITMGDSPGFIDVVYGSLPTSPAPLTPDAGSAQFTQIDLPPLHKSLRAMMESIEHIQHNPFPFPIARIFTWMSPSWRKSYNTISEFLNKHIREARERETEISKAKQGDGLATDADCVVDMIVQREAREGAETFDKGELLDELMTYVLAGQDTTAATLLWLFKYLPLDTKIQQRLHDEVYAAFGPVLDDNSPLDFNILNDSSRVPVLEAVIAETLRCAMIAPIVGRDRTEVMFPLGNMSTQESDWGSDAKIWRPARWLRDDGSFDSAAGPSFPFGIGQRACFGQRLAILQLKTYVATLSRAFMFKPLPFDVDNWDAILKVTREPKSFYVSLGGWSTD